jgi:hypothetical protein
VATHKVLQRITIQLVGAKSDRGDVRLNDFIDQLKTIRVALAERERLISGAEHPRIEYKIVDLHHSNSTVVLEPIPRDEAKAYADQVIEGFSKELRLIKREGKLLGEPDVHRLIAYSRIGHRSDNLISKTKIAVGRKPVVIDNKFKENIEKILGPDELVEGTVDGMLEAVNFHNTNKFTLYPTIGPRKVVGTFTDMRLREKVREGIGRYVTVLGKLRYKQWASFPHGVVAEDIDVHELDSELPKLSELRGAFAGVTENKDSLEFIEYIRNEGW